MYNTLMMYQINGKSKNSNYKAFTSFGFIVVVEKRLHSKCSVDYSLDGEEPDPSLARIQNIFNQIFAITAVGFIGEQLYHW